MKKITILFTKLILIIMLGFSTFTYAENSPVIWKEPSSDFKQAYDWVKFKSGEWLKGDIISMYDEELEFDSDELGVQTIDWSDIDELRSKELQSIRMHDGTIVVGYIVVKGGELSVVKNGISKPYDLNQLLSIASSGSNERDFWSGYLNVGLNLRNGNTVQLDYTFSTGLQRRSASSRLKADYTVDYSRYEDQDTLESITTADNQRFTSSYDWFFSPKIYLRVADVEYISDQFLNLDYRIHYGIGIGYHLIDTNRTTWDVNAGPSYQKSKFIDVEVGAKDTESSPGLTLGTDFTFEVTSSIDYSASYNVQVVEKESGGNIHHFQTGLEIDLLNDFDLDLTFYADRTNNPKTDSSGDIPKKNDYRLVVSFGYDF